jgi:transposase
LKSTTAASRSSSGFHHQMVRPDQERRVEHPVLGNIVQGLVERFFAWIGRNRRLAKDFEATIDSARAFFYAASVMLLVRRIARTS